MALRSLVSRKTLGLGLKLQFRGLQTFSLPDLPYDYGALEPAISGEIMQLHHQKHHQTYITNYNKSLEQLHHAMEKGDSSVVVKLQSAIKFNGGGFLFLIFFDIKFDNSVCLGRTALVERRAWMAIEFGSLWKGFYLFVYFWEIFNSNKKIEIWKESCLFYLIII